MTIKQKLNSILKKANLSEDLKILWQGAFEYLKIQDLNILVKTLEELSSEEIREFSENLKNKIVALENKDTSFWEKIIKQEQN